MRSRWVGPSLKAFGPQVIGSMAMLARVGGVNTWTHCVVASPQISMVRPSPCRLTAHSRVNGSVNAVSNTVSPMRRGRVK